MKHKGGAAAVTLLAANLAACGSISDQATSRALTAPGKYTIYDCQDLDRRAKSVRERQVELEQLMDRASQGTAGTLVSGLAYRTEYLQVRGDLEELQNAAADKKCATESKWSSGRALF